ncbi:MAG: UDP-N-acetylmuramoyl-L-alanine--D-glutamate ligase [Planctomycetia bacterium]
MSAAGSLRGRRALVLGLGRFSGGVETARFLVQQGADVLVSDAAPRTALEASAREAEDAGARLQFGPQLPALLEGRDLLVASPAIPFEHPVLLAAQARGLEVTTEINLFLARVRAPVLGVTGTKGKSTTSSLLASMLSAALHGSGRSVHLGGNVGRSLLNHLPSIQPHDLVVLELSSFQLWWTRREGRAPHVALVTNLFPDHLDRHGTMDEYAAAKRGMLEMQRPQDVAVLPADDPTVRDHGFLEAGPARRVLFGAGTPQRLEHGQLVLPGSAPRSLAAMRLWGEHNRRNALAAASAALQVAGVTPAHVQAGAEATVPLPHRLQPVAEAGGVLYVDDSNATTPQSAREALEAVPRPAIVLVGGKPKGVDMTPLVDALVRKAKAVVTIGSAGPEVARLLAGRVRHVAGGPDMAAAVAAACALAQPGDAVVLSPGYSSLDQYASFAERGDRFRDAALALPGARRA